MRNPFDSHVFERVQEVVDRRRLLLGLCAAVAVALIAAIPGILTSAGSGRRVQTTESAQAGTTTTVGEGSVSAELGAPMPTVPPPSSTTTLPVSVLGTSFTQAPTTTAPKAGGKSAPPPPTPTTHPAAPACHDSYDPACGQFSWQPAPAANQPRQVTLSSQSQTVPLGTQVTVHAVVNDPDDSQAFKCPATTYDFGDGPAMSTHCDPPPGTNPCPTRYGPWTPPAAAPGGGQEDIAHTYNTTGTFMVKFTYNPGLDDVCYNPYADGASGTLQITVIGP